ncbi:MAG TPA: cell envelope integrity protein CreD [Gemmatimonadaceae bacterium]|jgi:inner membrane protein
MKDSLDRVTTSMRNSQLLRLFVIAFLALLIQVPVSMISGLVTERQQRNEAAVAEVSSKWGEAQSITGPALVVPYTQRWTDESGDRPIARTARKNAIVLPDQLTIHGKMKSEVRRRGIFSVPVYKLGAQVEGEFARPRLDELGVSSSDIDWRHAQLAVGVSDARAIQETTTLTWNGQRVDFLPGTGGFVEAGNGIHAPVPIPDTAERIHFSFPLSLNGSLRTDVVPFGRTTTFDLAGDYPHPSFQGKWLPTERTITADNFSARWSIPFLGRGYPQTWSSDSASMHATIDASRFGVQLVDPVDQYHMADRSVKYAFLFIMLTFAIVWLIEVLAGVRVHPIQYLMLGGAMCLFYLLELALSEHLGFPVAYALASIAVIGMVGGYSLSVLRRAQHAAIVAAGVALLYGYLYLLLMNEDYALLIGSIGLFAILGAIMFVTRRVDWYAVGTRGGAGERSAAAAT